MPKQIVISDSRGIAYKMHGKLYRTVLPNGSVKAQEQPSELAAFIGIASQMFSDHRGNMGAQPLIEARAAELFDELKDLVGFKEAK